MKTSLKLNAYWIPAALLLLPVIAWQMLSSIDASSAVDTNFVPYFLLITVLCLGILAISLWTDYKEFSLDGEVLTIKNLITKQQTLIKLKDIQDLKLHQKSARNVSYHNIIVRTSNGDYTLKGLYVNEMVQFFYKLEEATKKSR